MTTNKLAHRFASVLREWFSAKEFAETRRRNRRRNNDSCASHDFCDANMAMLEAFETVYARPMVLEDTPDGWRDLALCNEAWDKAKRRFLS